MLNVLVNTAIANVAVGVDGPIVDPAGEIMPDPVNPAKLLYGTDLQDKVAGSLRNDAVYGFSGDDTLYGKEGDDTVAGNQGNDWLSGYTGNDTLYGNEGNDTILGGSGSDYLNGGVSEDRLSGGKGNDTMSGGNGNDTMVGDKGNDILYGGEGSDVFVFDKYNGQDTIQDFFNPGAASGDVIRISSAIYGTITELLQHITYQDGDAHIDFGCDYGVTIENILPGTLTGQDFEVM